MLKFLHHLIKYAFDKEIGRHAQALSFSTVLTLVPLTTIFLGVLASSNWTNIAKKTLESLLENNLFPKAISLTFSTYINIFAAQAAGIKTIGLIFFIISICFLFMDMENSFSAVVDCKTNKKWYLRVMSLFLLFIAPLLVFLLLGLSEWITNMSMRSIKEMLYTIAHYTATIKILFFFLTWAWFLFLYKVLPHKHIDFKSLCLGAFVATIAFNISQALFGLYMDNFSTFEIVYGVFSAIPVFLLWIYLNWQITLYGLLIAYFTTNHQNYYEVIVQQQLEEEQHPENTETTHEIDVITEDKPEQKEV